MYAHRFEKCDNLRSRLSWSRLSWKWARNKIVFQVIIHSHALERSAIILSRERPRSSSIREVTDSISFFFFFYLLVPLFPSRHRRDVEPRFIIFNSTSKNIAWKNRSSLNRKNARVESFFLLAANLSFRLFLTRYLFSYRWKNRVDKRNCYLYIYRKYTYRKINHRWHIAKVSIFHTSRSPIFRPTNSSG